MKRPIAHTQRFLQARAAAENDREPDWPASTRCSRCGADIWRVVTPDGDDIELDSEHIEVEVGGRIDGDVRRARASFVWKEAQRVDGWRLEDPVEAMSGWLWGATPTPLAQALVEPLFSEHVYSCSRASEREIRSLVAAAPRPTLDTLSGPQRSKQLQCAGNTGLDPAQPLEHRNPVPRRSEQLALWGV